MKRTRYHKKKQNHFCLLINREAANYNYRYIKRLIGAIRKNNAYYTVFEPKSAMSLYSTAQKVCGLKRWGRSVPEQFNKRGKVTALVACGGDGTFNLTARTALKAKIPMGVLPMGSENNIAMSVLHSDNPDLAIKKIINQKYRMIDCGQIGDQFFFGSIGLGYITELCDYLKKNGKPRFSIGWNKLGSKIAQNIKFKKMLIKIDAFRFEVSPSILNVNLSPYSAGLKISPTSIIDDKQAEVIFDITHDKKNIASFTREIYKNKYIFNRDIKLFSGREISFQPVKNMNLYLDGEIIKLPNDFIDIKIGEEQLKVFC